MVHSPFDLLNQLRSAVLFLDSQERIEYLNPSAERLFSTSLNQARGKNLTSLIYLDPLLQRSIEEALQEGRSILIHENEIQLRHKPRHLKLRLEVSAVRNLDSLSGVLILAQELSWLQSLQEEKRRHDRLAMLGTMASGLAHEIRNPLGGIRAAAEMWVREAKSEDEKEYSSIIISEVDRLNRLVSELLEFSRPQKIKKKPVNINQILAELLRFHFQANLPDNILIKQEFDPSLPPIEGNADALKQAFLNLIRNAVEAMPQGGTLSLSTHFSLHSKILVQEGKASPMVEIGIRDTGLGIPDEKISSLFTPFFSTKSQGTGLGLMITERIIKEHEGLIEVESEAQRGTCFKVFLRFSGRKSRRD